MPAQPPPEPKFVAFDPAPIFTAEDVADIIRQTRLKPVNGGESDLLERLNRLNIWYAAVREFDSGPLPSRLKIQLGQFSGYVERLLDKLDVDNKADPIDGLPSSILKELADTAGTWADDHPDHELLERHPLIKGPVHDPAGEDASLITNVQVTVPRGRALVREAIEWTLLLNTWFESSQSFVDERIQANKKGRKANHSGDAVLGQLILNLGVIFEDTFGQRPGFSDASSSDIEKEGPFYRFLDSCLDTYDVPPESRTGDALRNRWRRVTRPAD